MIPTPPEHTALLGHLEDLILEVLGPDTVAEVKDKGTLHTLFWEDGPSLAAVKTALESVENAEWVQTDQTKAYVVLRLEGVSGHRHPTILLHRGCSPLAVAYAVMSFGLRYWCQCSNRAFPPEAYEEYNASLNQPAAHRVESHPTLLETGCAPAELQRMAEILSVLAHDTGDPDLYYDDVYCDVGHFEGLRHLAAG